MTVTPSIVLALFILPVFEGGEIETGFFKEWVILTDFWTHLDTFSLRGHGSVVEYWNNY